MHFLRHPRPFLSSYSVFELEVEFKPIHYGMIHQKSLFFNLVPLSICTNDNRGLSFPVLALPSLSFYFYLISFQRHWVYLIMASCASCASNLLHLRDVVFK